MYDSLSSECVREPPRTEGHSFHLAPLPGRCSQMKHTLLSPKRRNKLMACDAILAPREKQCQTMAEHKCVGSKHQSSNIEEKKFWRCFCRVGKKNTPWAPLRDSQLAHKVNGRASWLCGRIISFGLWQMNLQALSHY